MIQIQICTWNNYVPGLIWSTDYVDLRDIDYHKCTNIGYWFCGLKLHFPSYLELTYHACCLKFHALGNLGHGDGVENTFPFYVFFLVKLY